jgi:hypothetical protein
MVSNKLARALQKNAHLCFAAAALSVSKPVNRFDAILPQCEGNHYQLKQIRGA